MKRREFISKAALASISLPVLGSAFIESCASVTGPNVTHGTSKIDVSSLTTDNSSLVYSAVEPDGTPILVVRKSATNYLALSMYCTHQGCQVNSPRNQQIYCGCHGSVFDLSGNVIQGPANSPLAKYTSTYDASTRMLTVTY